MRPMIESCVRVLEAAGIKLGRGLTPLELAEIERRHGVAFGADHRDLLLTAVPLGSGWVDWRRDGRSELRSRLSAPVDGVLFDVSNSAFWPASWGPRPGAPGDALALARRELASWPKLVPLYGHRYVPAGPAGAGAPVFSVVQTDVIFFGANLLDYLRREFGGADGPVDSVRVDVPPWSLLATGYESADL